MKVEYTPTYTEFKTCVKLDRKHNRSNLVIHILMTWLAPSAAAMVIMTMLLTSQRVKVTYTSGSMVTFAALAMCLWAPFIERRALRGQFRSIFPANTKIKRVSATIDETGIQIEIPEAAMARYQWTAFVRSAQDSDSILLYTTRTKFLFLPASAFTAVQRAEFEDLIARHITSRKPC